MELICQFDSSGDPFLGARGVDVVPTLFVGLHLTAFYESNLFFLTSVYIEIQCSSM